MKNVVEKTATNEVLIDNIDPYSKIYASEPFYKLHRINGQWMFCSLEGSVGGGTGVYNTAKEAIRSVYEFETAKEFLQWALEQE